MGEEVNAICAQHLYVPQRLHCEPNILLFLLMLSLIFSSFMKVFESKILYDTVVSFAFTKTIEKQQQELSNNVFKVK